MSDQVFEPLILMTARPLLLPEPDIDTDQIYPARFLTVTTRHGFADYAFRDWRFEPDGTLRAENTLNKTPADQRRIFVVGRNFGCGSSREHAPWALYDFGVRVILGESLADIFRSNCLKNGIAALNVPAAFVQSVCAAPERRVEIDLERLVVAQEGGEPVSVELDELMRRCLMNGEDLLSSLVAAEADIATYERGTSPKVQGVEG